ncbi:MAG: hydroxymethylbilane synthase [Polyangiales bacterium]
MTTLRLATRKSALALAQSRMVAAAVARANPGVTVEEVQIVTQGDRVQDRPLSAIGGKGLFVKEIEEALLDGRADFAVHSMKDLPADLAPGLAIACVPTRESPWDLLVTADGRALDALPQGARVGTSSKRRELILRALRPDLDVQMLRGNVDTRLRKLTEGSYDAVILAEAGVRRLGLTVTAARLEGAMVPAVAQGALALECRADDDATARCLAALHDHRAALETAAERAVMRALGGSCTVPMGALARWDEATGALAMEGFYAREDGSAAARRSHAGRAKDAGEAEAVGAALAGALRDGLTA